MPKVTKAKIGRVFLKEIEKRKWRVDWRDPQTKTRYRVILPAATFREAERQAQVINSEVAAGHGFSYRIRDSVGHSVSDAVLEAIKHSNANQRTRRDYLGFYNRFADYLLNNAGGVQAWADVTEQVLGNYIEHCRREGLAHDTIRLRLYVLRMTAAYMAQTYPGQYRNVAVNLKLRRKDPPKAEIEAKSAILGPCQLGNLLGWLKDNEPMVYVWAALQGLCGLRLREAAYLREQDFDPKAKTITITKTSAHKPKNRPSYRTIPICPAAAVTISSWIVSLKVRHNEGYLFTPLRGIKGRQGALSEEAKVGVYTFDRINHLWGVALKRARADGVNIPKQFTCRRLRGTFITAMRKAGADFEILQAYVGHAPSSVLSAHYDYIDLNRLAVIAGKAQDLYEGIGAFKEQGVDANKNSSYGQ